MKKSDVAIVVPAYNEEVSIKNVLADLNFKKYLTIVVDDGSTDNTYKISKKLADYSLRHVVNLGKGSAMKTGSDFAFNILNKKAVIFFDADGQHDVSDISKFIKKLDKFDFVTGVRSINREMPKIRSFGNYTVSILVKIFYGKYFEDIPCGFKAITIDAYKKVIWESRDYSVELEMSILAAKYKLSNSSVNIITKYNKTDKGMTMLDVIRVAIKLFEFKLKI